MFETAFALGLTQFARSLSFPERLSRRPVRNAALEPWRLRNTGLDALYYDVKALTAEETFYVSDSIASEGLIMIVPPTGHGMLTLCDSVEEYRLRGGKDVHAMAVAGIGGSAIGAAAFARNVADALGQPVAAVVSGYGLGDLVNEAIGGAFLFGWMGHIRGNLEAIDDAVGRPKLGAYGQRAADTNPARRTGLDSDTVATLLADKDLSFTFIAGHSRGNKVIADALFTLKRNDSERLATLVDACRVVTFGGRIKMPEAFTEVIDVVGELDWFGELNSRPKIPADLKVPFCGHSTNTDLPGTLHVTKILKGIMARGAAVETPILSTAPEAAPEEIPASTLPAAPVTALAPKTEIPPEPAVEAKPEPISALTEEPVAADEVASTTAIDLQSLPVATPLNVTDRAEEAVPTSLSTAVMEPAIPVEPATTEHVSEPLTAQAEAPVTTKAIAQPASKPVVPPRSKAKPAAGKRRR